MQKFMRMGQHIGEPNMAYRMITTTTTLTGELYEWHGNEFHWDNSDGYLNMPQGTVESAV
jgi:hypothetical protein